jgi:uncharacterized protein DUF4349
VYSKLKDRCRSSFVTHRNKTVPKTVYCVRFEEARSEIRKLGLRVEADRQEAQDATKDYVDLEARLHALRAQETQYLSILKEAKTVKDILGVSDKLNEVRGEIEQQQAEFRSSVQTGRDGSPQRVPEGRSGCAGLWRAMAAAVPAQVGSPRRIAKLGGLRNDNGFVCLLFAVNSLVACNHLGRRGYWLARFALGCASSVWF